MASYNLSICILIVFISISYVLSEYIGVLTLNDQEYNYILKRNGNKYRKLNKVYIDSKVILCGNTMVEEYDFKFCLNKLKDLIIEDKLENNINIALIITSLKEYYYFESIISNPSFGYKIIQKISNILIFGQFINFESLIDNISKPFSLFIIDNYDEFSKVILRHLVENKIIEKSDFKGYFNINSDNDIRIQKNQILEKILNVNYYTDKSITNNQLINDSLDYYDSYNYNSNLRTEVVKYMKIDNYSNAYVNYDLRLRLKNTEVMGYIIIAMNVLVLFSVIVIRKLNRIYDLNNTNNPFSSIQGEDLLTMIFFIGSLLATILLINTSHAYPISSVDKIFNLLIQFSIMTFKFNFLIRSFWISIVRKIKI